MRSLLALLTLALLASGLAGCTSSDAPTDLPQEPPSAAFRDEVFAGGPEDGTPAGDARSHGEPQRDDGSVETGMSPPLQIPMFWARRTITISNDFGGASLGTVFVGADSGSIVVMPGDGDDYTIEVTLESRGSTEQEARDELDRLTVDHTDTMEDDGLHLSTVLRRSDQTTILPGVNVAIGTWTYADIKVTLPAGPAYDLSTDTSFGNVAVSGLRGPSFQFTGSSGDIELSQINARDLSIDTSSGQITLDTVQADILEAASSSGDLSGSDLRIGTAQVDASSGDIDLEGAIDTLEADASSGSITVTAHGRSTGVYDLAASSGDITVELLSGTGRAYHVKAEASSGKVDVDLNNSDTIDEDDDGVEVISDDFDTAAIQTVVDVSTSSGDITVSDSPTAHRADDDEARNGL